jgi:alkanesulfonate monooxygenase SsuD/methylene tetrahydromethanopterin reductase-like flavin-dependent oxidoreductase (luciferase family)
MRTDRQARSRSFAAELLAPKEGIRERLGERSGWIDSETVDELADEFNVYPGAKLPERIDRFRDAATEAGRDPDSIRLSSSGQVVAAESEREFEEMMDENASEAGLSREELEAHYEKRHTPRGTYEQVRAQLDGFEQLGISRFYFQGVFSPSDTGKLLDGLGVT